MLLDKERILVSISIGTENQSILSRRRCNGNNRRRIINYNGIALCFYRIVIIIGSHNSKIVNSVRRYRTGTEHTVPSQRLRYFNTGFCCCQEFPKRLSIQLRTPFFVRNGTNNFAFLVFKHANPRHYVAFIGDG